MEDAEGRGEKHLSRSGSVRVGDIASAAVVKEHAQVRVLGSRKQVEMRGVRLGLRSGESIVLPLRVVATNVSTTSPLRLLVDELKRQHPELASAWPYRPCEAKGNTRIGDFGEITSRRGSPFGRAFRGDPRRCGADQTIAGRQNNNDLTFLAADHQGTGELDINPTTGAVSQRRFDPYGMPRGKAAGTWPGAKGLGAALLQ